MPRTGSPDDRTTSYLVKDTREMANEQRLREQKGLRALTRASVKEGDHPDEPVTAQGDEPGYGDDLKQHPLLDGQQFDGVENNPPDPGLNPQAREKYKEEQRHQEHEKQLRLELQLQNQPQNQPTYSSAPKPRGP